MRFSLLSGLFAASYYSSTTLVAADEHGGGDEGTIMGPVAFLWPDDRPWSAAFDNIGPCGSSSGVGNRTIFPLSQGEVALSIADDAWEVAFYVSFDSNPDEQSEFTEQIVTNITEILPGHHCYKIAAFPSSVKAGSNGTIQLEYWATYGNENGGKNESFFACADVTFVEAADFNLTVPCFNVTAVDFTPSIASVASTATFTGTATAVTTFPAFVTGTALPSTSSSAGAAVTASSTPSAADSGLSAGTKAGIAVGSIVGGIAIIAVGTLALLRRRRRTSRVNEIPLVIRKPNDAISVASSAHH